MIYLILKLIIMKIGFIGTGNIAIAIITGLLKNSYSNKNIYISDINKNILIKHQKNLNINTANDNKQLADICDIVILAVKPNIIKQVCSQIASIPIKLLISVAAGIRIASIKSWLNTTTTIVRLMPNTPAVIGYGATGIYADNITNNSQKKQINNIVNSIGIGIWIDNEELIDTITAISGSGPAYFFYMIEAIIASAVELGLDKKDAHRLVTQTALGASIMAQNTKKYETLRANVTSPNGTTYAAISSMNANNIDKNIKQAIKLAYIRAKELADELAK